jgi:hypothetical protein
MRKVRAKAKGFCGVKIRKPGEEFMFSGAPARWFEEVTQPKAKIEKEEEKPLKHDKAKAEK